MATEEKAKKEKSKAEKIKVSFRLGENEGNPAEFTFQGKGYILYNGTEVTLPVDVVEHLNSLKYPQHKFEVDEKTGQMVSKLVGYKHRFFCVPVDMRQAAEKQAQAE
jgi:hypothetical protein